MLFQIKVRVATPPILINNVRVATTAALKYSKLSAVAVWFNAGTGPILTLKFNYMYNFNCIKKVNAVKCFTFNI